MKRVSFDYDGTLTIDTIQEYAKYLIELGIEVWICTPRFEHGYEHPWGGREYSNNDLLKIAKNLGIKKIIFTNMADKYEHLENNDIIWHLDDLRDEVDLLNEHTNIKGILVTKSWKEKCDNLLKL